MNIIIGLMIAFIMVHIIVGLTTNYTSFYWVGKMFVELEAIQNSVIHSVHSWFRSWKVYYKEERSHLKGVVNV